MGTFFLDILSEVADRPNGKYLHHSKFAGCRHKNSSACTEYERTILPGLSECFTYALVSVSQNVRVRLLVCHHTATVCSLYNYKLHVYFSTLKDQHHSRQTRCHSLWKEVSQVLKVVQQVFPKVGMYLPRYKSSYPRRQYPRLLATSFSSVLRDKINWLGNNSKPRSKTVYYRRQHVIAFYSEVTGLNLSKAALLLAFLVIFPSLYEKIPE
jgi:hypothetical protein